MNEKGQAWLIAILVVAIAILLIGLMTGPDRCAANIAEILQFWRNFCHEPIYPG